MSELSNWMEAKVIDHLFNKTAFTQETELWVAACTATISDSDTGSTITEPGGGSYARAKTYTADWTRAGNVIDNDLDIVFTTATGSWGTITDIGLVDASSAGNLWAYTTITSKAIDTNDTLRFLAGDLDFSLD